MRLFYSTCILGKRLRKMSLDNSAFHQNWDCVLKLTSGRICCQTRVTDYCVEGRSTPMLPVGRRTAAAATTARWRTAGPTAVAWRQVRRSGQFLRAEKPTQGWLKTGRRHKNRESRIADDAEKHFERRSTYGGTFNLVQACRTWLRRLMDYLSRQIPLPQT